jgi:hypothetical protein
MPVQDGLLLITGKLNRIPKGGWWTGLPPYLPVGLATAMIPSSNDFSATLRRREAELRYTRFWDWEITEAICWEARSFLQEDKDKNNLTSLGPGEQSCGSAAR